MKAEVSAEEALGEREARWTKAREVPADDESESYSYEEDEDPGVFCRLGRRRRRSSFEDS